MGGGAGSPPIIHGSCCRFPHQPLESVSLKPMEANSACAAREPTRQRHSVAIPSGALSYIRQLEGSVASTGAFMIPARRNPRNSMRAAMHDVPVTACLSAWKQVSSGRCWPAATGAVPWCDGYPRPPCRKKAPGQWIIGMIAFRARLCVIWRGRPPIKRALPCYNAAPAASPQRCRRNSR